MTVVVVVSVNVIVATVLTAKLRVRIRETLEAGVQLRPEHLPVDVAALEAVAPLTLDQGALMQLVGPQVRVDQFAGGQRVWMDLVLCQMLLMLVLVVARREPVLAAAHVLVASGRCGCCHGRRCRLELGTRKAEVVLEAQLMASNGVGSVLVVLL